MTCACGSDEIEVEEMSISQDPSTRGIGWVRMRCRECGCRQDFVAPRALLDVEEDGVAVTRAGAID
jgi:hypothetical protein